MQKVPLTNDADQQFTNVLGGQSVRIRATWQDTGASWFLSLIDDDESPLFTGTRIKSGIPVINFKLIDFVGDFVAVVLDVSALEPGRNAWGETHELYYLNSDESDEVRNAFIPSSV